MLRPGIIAYHGSSNKALSYCELNRGAATYLIHVPAKLSPASIYWFPVHNLLEPMGNVSGVTGVHFSYAEKRELAMPFSAGRVRSAHVFLPMFAPVTRPANIHFAKYGETTPQGLHVRDPEDIHKVYVKIMQSEARSGQGLVNITFARRTRELMYHYAGRTYQILTGKRPLP